MKYLSTITFIIIFIFSRNFLAAQVSAQKAIISFTSDSDCSVDIFDTMDNFYNDQQSTKTLIIQKGKTTTYLTKEIKDLAVISLDFSNIGKTEIIIFPKDSIGINLSQAAEGKHKLIFQGNNHEGQQYMHENYYGIPLMKYMTIIDSSLKEYKEHKKNIDSIIPEINEKIMNPLLKGIDATSSTSGYIHAAKTDVQCYLLSYICLAMDMLISKKYIETSRSDSAIIVSKIDSITHLIPLSSELCCLPSGRLYASTKIKYSKQSEDVSSIFGKYKDYLSAPEYMWLPMLSQACLTQFRFGVNEMNVKEVAKFLEEKYPKSEYVKLIKQKVKEQEITTPFNPKFISKTIDSLSQLKDIPELKGKILFIDLWASWCAPCRQELTRQKDLHQILSVFDKIETVYISIDKPEQEKVWKEMTKHFRLEGYHLRANNKLNNDIERSIFGNTNMEIPRYFLLSPEGKIINTNLPRPSQKVLLKTCLEKILKDLL